MLALSSICFIIALFTLLTGTISGKRKRILLKMQLCSGTWLFADRIAYIYHGVSGRPAMIAVYVSNFLVFFLTIAVLASVNRYMEDVLVNEGGMEKVPLPLKIGDLFSYIAEGLVILSQFTGLYYTFDASNTYIRSPLYFVSYIFPYSILIIQFVMLCIHRRILKGKIAFSLYLFVFGCIFFSMVQFFIYGISWMDMTAVTMVILVYLFAFLDMNERAEKANRIVIERLKDEQAGTKRLFEQTASLLAYAIDAKNPLTKGRLERIAGYSRDLAKMSGHSEDECDRIYYSALLHDVGKLGVPEDIVRRENDLTAEDDELLKRHPEMGEELLSGITAVPFLKYGARSHNERYDGHGYPDGLKGDMIPEVARIIAVANTYDAMTSKRIFSEPLPQNTVREELMKMAGFQLDPKYVGIMTDMIDSDREYALREKSEENVHKDETDITRVSVLNFDEYKDVVSDGIRLTENFTEITFSYIREKGYDPARSLPALILFDSLDACVHKDESSVRILDYLEYAEIWLDGHTVSTAARNLKVDTLAGEDQESYSVRGDGSRIYRVKAAKYRDHVVLIVSENGKSIKVTVALPDAIRYAYMAFTGEHCRLSGFDLKVTDEPLKEGDFERIAEEVSFIECPEGDIPNVQVEGNRTAESLPVALSDGMRMDLRVRSLPTASLIWHCPYILVFSSGNGRTDSEDYKEICCVRFDGEDATRNGTAQNEITVKRGDAFESWDKWKNLNKKGYESEIRFFRRRNRIGLETENGGIILRCSSILTDKTDKVYVALTGDQVALTDIRVLR